MWYTRRIVIGVKIALILGGYLCFLEENYRKMQNIWGGGTWEDTFANILIFIRFSLGLH